MRFKHLFLWLKFTLVTPSFYFKNRLFIEKGFRQNPMYTYLGNTQKSFTWLQSSSGNLTLYWFKKRWLFWLSVVTIAALLLFFAFNFNIISPLLNLHVLQVLYYLIWRLLDFLLFFTLQLYTLFVLTLYSVATWFINRLLSSKVYNLFNREGVILKAPGYQPHPHLVSKENLPGSLNMHSFSKLPANNNFKTAITTNWLINIKRFFSLNRAMPAQLNTRVVTPKSRMCSFLLPITSSPHVNHDTSKLTKPFRLTNIMQKKDYLVTHHATTTLSTNLGHYRTGNSLSGLLDASKSKIIALYKTFRWVYLNTPAMQKDQLLLNKTATNLNLPNLNLYDASQKKLNLMGFSNSMQWHTFRLKNTALGLNFLLKPYKLNNSGDIKTKGALPQLTNMALSNRPNLSVNWALISNLFLSDSLERLYVHQAFQLKPKSTKLRLLKNKKRWL